MSFLFHAFPYPFLYPFLSHCFPTFSSPLVEVSKLGNKSEAQVRIPAWAVGDTPMQLFILPLGVAATDHWETLKNVNCGNQYISDPVDYAFLPTTDSKAKVTQITADTKRNFRESFQLHWTLPSKSFSLLCPSLSQHASRANIYCHKKHRSGC